jgi:hypothetical protein
MRGSGQRARGQVLVLFELSLVVLLGFAALVIDVAGFYAKLRRERAVADAAVLAGAQDLFRAGSTSVDNTEWTAARTVAMRTAVAQITGQQMVSEADLPTCAGHSAPYDVDIVNCPIAGTPYYVSVAAPAPTCASASCDPTRSIQVTIRDPRHRLSFARVLAQDSWNAWVTSVAERDTGADFMFVTLRPPKPSNAHDPRCSPACDSNEDDVSLDGTNTKLTVRGDMGTNTNMILTAGATVAVDPGSVTYRYDGYKGWTGSPPDKHMSAPIVAPGYPYPVRPADTSLIYLKTDLESKYRLDGSSCDLEIAAIPAAYGVSAGGGTAGSVACYRPGDYQFRLSSPPGVSVMILTPGVYFLDAGFMPGSGVKAIGGYDATTSGVALVFPRSCNPDCSFAGNAAGLIALNAGDAYPSGSGATPSAAVNWNGTTVDTGGSAPLPLTLLVERDPRCSVGPVDPPACREAQNKQLNLPGGGSLFAFGVQYAPTDNVKIAGGSASDGYLGQIWAWTVQYTGGSNINITGASNPRPGVMRIATPCSPGTACVNPEAFSVIP